jgi:hypothetical protein
MQHTIEQKTSSVFVLELSMALILVSAKEEPVEHWKKEGDGP